MGAIQDEIEERFERERWLENAPWRQKEKNNWQVMLDRLYSLTPNSGITNRKFESKLDDLKDFVRARIQEIKV